ncbi:MAG: cation:proton antiporter, partial [Spirochaetota bacterium]
MEFLISTSALPLFLVMLTAALLSPIVAQVVRIPASVSLVAIGMLAGLPFLGLESSALAGASSIGLVFAFFLIGSAIDTSRLGRLGTRALLFAIVAFTSALLLGWLLGTKILGLGTIDALLVGVVFGAAAPFSKQLAARLETTEARDSTSLQAANELGEILRLFAFIILLALRGTKSLVGFVEAPWALGLLGTLAGAIAIALVLTFFGSRWFGRSTRAAGLGFLVFSLAGFGAAALGILIGLPPAFASFVSGLALGRFAPEGSLLQERMLFVGRNLFLPLALVPAGMGLASMLSADAPRVGFSVVAAIMTAGLAIIPRFLAGLALLPFGPLSRFRQLAMLATAPGQEPSTLFFVLYLASAGFAKGYGPAILIGLLPALWLLESISGGQGGQESRRQRSTVLPGAAPGRRKSRS